MEASREAQAVRHVMSVGTDFRQVPAVREIDESVADFLRQVGLPEVKNEADVTKAEEIRKEVKVKIDHIEKTLGPYREAAYKSHKGWTALIRASREKLEHLNTVLVARVRAWKLEEERQREAERKALEDKRLEEAAALEERGQDTAAKLAVQTAEVESERLVRPNVKLDKRIYGEKWEGQLTSKVELCKAIGKGEASPDLVDVNQAELNRVARAVKEKLDIPGIKAVRVR